jgi:hypothetical protein
MNWFKRRKHKPSTASQQNQDKDNFVNVLDTATNSVTRMPARELAPYMVQVNMEGIEGLVWMDVRELKQNIYQHPPFCEDVRDLLREIKASIDEFYCLSLEEWEDGFRRDGHPEQEIGLWLHLSRTYRGLTTSRDLSVEQRHDYFWALVACLNSPREHVLKVFSPNAISVEEAKDVITQFFDTRN